MRSSLLAGSWALADAPAVNQDLYLTAVRSEQNGLPFPFMHGPYAPMISVMHLLNRGSVFFFLVNNTRFLIGFTVGQANSICLFDIICEENSSDKLI